MVILNRDSIKIQISDSNQEKLKNTLGIDMGQSLTKIAYFDKDQLNLSCFPTKGSYEKISNFLNGNKSNFNHINLTGGKAYELFKKYNDSFQCQLIDEFKAMGKGIDFIFQEYKKRSLPHCLIVSIGTGTSITLKENDYLHIGGTALGGGFFMGIATLLYDINDYEKILNLAKNGNRYNVDLKVSDIYHLEDKRISDIFREFTASSLGKIDMMKESKSIKRDDVLNSIISLIGENIGLIVSITAKSYNIDYVIYCGGFTLQNSIVNSILKIISKLNGLSAIFLKNSEYCGAIGALIET